MKTPSRQLQLEIDGLLSAPAAQAPPTKSGAELDREIAAAIAANPPEIELTKNGAVTREAKLAASRAQARGDYAEIDRLQKKITDYLGNDPRHWLTGSSQWIARANRKAAEKAALAAPAPAVDPARARAFEAKQEDKRERLEKASARAASEASARFSTAHRIGDAIPFGQPILRGHHSEKRHRRDIAKIDNAMRKGVEADKAAKDLARRAESVGTAGISSDDPAAVIKLKVELNKLRLDQDRMKAGNAAIRKYAKAGPDAQVAALIAMGFSEKLARSALEKDFAGRIGFPAYAITNNGANIRRIEKRILELTAKETAPARAATVADVPGVGEVRIEDNKDLNRTQIRFANGKPPDAVRARLKSAGFKWAPSEDAWQRQASNGAWYHAHTALGLKP